MTRREQFPSRAHSLRRSSGRDALADPGVLRTQNVGAGVMLSSVARDGTSGVGPLESLPWCPASQLLEPVLLDDVTRLLRVVLEGPPEPRRLPLSASTWTRLGAVCQVTARDSPRAGRRRLPVL